MAISLRSQKISGIVTPVCALVRNDVLIGGNEKTAFRPRFWGRKTVQSLPRYHPHSPFGALDQALTRPRPCNGGHTGAP